MIFLTFCHIDIDNGNLSRYIELSDGSFVFVDISGGGDCMIAQADRN